MWLADQWRDFSLMDAGHGMKLEQWGPYLLSRPEPQAMWAPQSPAAWEAAHAVYHRSHAGGGQWEYKEPLPDQWEITYANKLRFIVRPTGFKHTGLFPEQAANWNFIYDNCVRMRAEERTPKVLNLFAYTGGATLAARAAGADTTHVDSVKQVVTWARENMEQSGLEGVRWIVEDALKFVQREVRRGNRYNGIILDPPAYGRGANGEKWILEDNIGEMLECCARLLEPRGAFLVLNLYSMGLSATLASTAVRQAFGTPFEEQFGELCFDDRAGKRLPLGTYCRFVR